MTTTNTVHYRSDDADYPQALEFLHRSPTANEMREDFSYPHLHAVRMVQRWVHTWHLEPHMKWLNFMKASHQTDIPQPIWTGIWMRKGIPTRRGERTRYKPIQVVIYGAAIQDSGHHLVVTLSMTGEELEITVMESSYYEEYVRSLEKK